MTEPSPANEGVAGGGGWAVERLPDGTVVWTSPTGHVYHRTPDPYPIDTTCKIKNDTNDTDTGEPDTTGADATDDGTSEAEDDRPPF